MICRKWRTKCCLLKLQYVRGLVWLLLLLVIAFAMKFVQNHGIMSIFPHLMPAQR